MHKVQINIQPKHVVLALLALVVIASAIIAGIEYELRHMRLGLSGFDALADLATTAKVITLSVPRCEAAVKHSPAGDPKQEATMVYVAGVVDLYRTTFGKLPENITDLDKLPTFANADKLNGEEMRRTCSLGQVPSNRAYVLACGGKLPSPERLDSALGKTVDERFMFVDGIELLHVPLSGGCI